MAENDTITIHVDHRIEQALTTLTRGGTSPTAAIEQAILETARRTTPTAPTRRTQAHRTRPPPVL